MTSLTVEPPVWGLLHIPRRINGLPVRERGASCPICDARPERWCDPGCAALDVMDYR